MANEDPKQRLRKFILELLNRPAVGMDSFGQRVLAEGRRSENVLDLRGASPEQQREALRPQVPFFSENLSSGSLEPLNPSLATSGLERDPSSDAELLDFIRLLLRRNLIKGIPKSGPIE